MRDGKKVTQSQMPTKAHKTKRHEFPLRWRGICSPTLRLVFLTIDNERVSYRKEGADNVRELEMDPCRLAEDGLGVKLATQSAAQLNSTQLTSLTLDDAFETVSEWPTFLNISHNLYL